MGALSVRDIIFSLCQFAYIAVIIIAPIVITYIFGRVLSRKYQVSKWFFWISYLFAAPVIAAPLLLFLCAFMDKVKHDFMLPFAWLLINSFSLWLILGFVSSMKLYDKIPPYFAIIPSIMSWIFAVLAVWGGLFLVSF